MAGERPLPPSAEAERKNGYPSQRRGVNVVRCPRCDGWVHSCNGYRCKTCRTRRITVRVCDECGETVTSWAGFFCAACHFTGWLGRWA